MSLICGTVSCRHRASLAQTDQPSYLNRSKGSESSRILPSELSPLRGGQRPPRHLLPALDLGIPREGDCSLCANCWEPQRGRSAQRPALPSQAHRC